MLDMATQQGLLSPIGADPIKMRTSLYANDAMVFLRPSTYDVENLKQLLDNFGMVTGLVTNIEKSEIVENLKQLLDNFGMVIGLVTDIEKSECEGLDITTILFVTFATHNQSLSCIC
jgi:histidinol phosphatase-like PHP family hydrolase